MDSPASDQAQSPPPPPLTILVVDDAIDMRMLARAVLESDGIEVVAEATDGHEALRLYRELKPPPIPTVILLDQMMPRMTGVEAAKEILAEMPDQLIVLFSAYLSDEVRAEAAAIGVTACVSKVDVGKLPAIVRGVATARS